MPSVIRMTPGPAPAPAPAGTVRFFVGTDLRPYVIDDQGNVSALKGDPGETPQIAGASGALQFNDNGALGALPGNGWNGTLLDLPAVTSENLSGTRLTVPGVGIFRARDGAAGWMDLRSADDLAQGNLSLNAITARADWPAVALTAGGTGGNFRVRGDGLTTLSGWQGGRLQLFGNAPIVFGGAHSGEGGDSGIARTEAAHLKITDGSTGLGKLTVGNLSLPQAGRLNLIDPSVYNWGGYITHTGSNNVDFSMGAGNPLRFLHGGNAIATLGANGFKTFEAGQDLLTVDNTNDGRLRLDATGAHAQFLEITPRHPSTGGEPMITSGNSGGALWFGADSSIIGRTAALGTKWHLKGQTGLVITSNFTTSVPLEVRGMTGQTANIQEWGYPGEEGYELYVKRDSAYAYSIGRNTYGNKIQFTNGLITATSTSTFLNSASIITAANASVFAQAGTNGGLNVRADGTGTLALGNTTGPTVLNGSQLTVGTMTTGASPRIYFGNATGTARPYIEAQDVVNGAITINAPSGTHTNRLILSGNGGVGNAVLSYQDLTVGPTANNSKLTLVSSGTGNIELNPASAKLTTTGTSYEATATYAYTFKTMSGDALTIGNNKVISPGGFSMGNGALELAYARAGGYGTDAWLQVQGSGTGGGMLELRESAALGTPTASHGRIGYVGGAFRFSGDVHATKFYGDGSGLTNLPGGGGSTDWANPGAIGSTTPNTGAFTTLSATGAITSTASWPANILTAPSFAVRSDGVTTINSGTGGYLAFSPSNANPGNADLILQRGGAGILEQRNGANAQAFNVYSTYTDASNYGRVRYHSSGITYEKAGTGPAQHFTIRNDSGTSGAIIFSTNAIARWNVDGNGVLAPIATNTYAIGSNSSAPSQVWGVSHRVTSDGDIIWNGRSVIKSPLDGTILLQNNGMNGFNRLAFGDITASSPSLYRNSTTLQVELADGTGFAPLKAAAATFRSSGDALTLQNGSGTAVLTVNNAGSISAGNISAKNSGPTHIDFGAKVGGIRLATQVHAIHLNPANNIVEQRGGANPQVHHIYHGWTTDLDYRRGTIGWDGSNQFIIGAEAAGTYGTSLAGYPMFIRAGYLNSLYLQTGSGTGWMLDANSHLTPLADAVDNIGSATNRANEVHAVKFFGDGSGLTNLPGGYEPFPVTDSAATALTLAKTHELTWTRFTSATAVTVTVPQESTVAWAPNTEMVFQQGGTGQVTFVPDTNVVIDTSSTLKTSAQNSVVALKRVATNVWVLTGEKQAL